MSSKINRLRAERGKNDEKIAVLRARNNEIDKQITELENLDIVVIVRVEGIGAVCMQIRCNKHFAEPPLMSWLYYIARCRYIASSLSTSSSMASWLWSRWRTISASALISGSALPTATPIPAFSIMSRSFR